MSLLWYFIFGYAIIELEAVRVEHALGRIAEAGVELVSIRRDSYTVVHAKVKSTDLKKLRRILSGSARVTVEKYGGIRALFWLLKRHVVLAAGALLALLAVLVISFFCFKVEVVGTETISPQELCRIVEESGARPVMLKSRIDIDAVERAVWKAFPDLIYVYASFDGVSLVVEVREGVPVPEIYDTRPSSVYALCDGVITEIIVYSGKAVACVGDRVRKGDLLITGEYESNGMSFSVAAGGRVTARTEYISTVVSGADCTELVLTGKVATERVMLFLNNRIHLSGGNPFSLFTEESRVTSTLGENYPVQIELLEVTYREAEAVYSEEKKQAVVTAAKKATYQHICSLLPEDAEVCAVYSYVTDSAEGIFITLTVSAYEQIGARGGALAALVPRSAE